jgi:hypothetical protein
MVVVGREIERNLAVLTACIAIVLGALLFKWKATTTSDVDAALDDKAAKRSWRLTLKRFAPGTLFALGGLFVLIWAIKTQPEIPWGNYTPPQQGQQPPAQGQQPAGTNQGQQAAGPGLGRLRNDLGPRFDSLLKDVTHIAATRPSEDDQKKYLLGTGAQLLEELASDPSRFAVEDSKQKARLAAGMQVLKTCLELAQNKVTDFPKRLECLSKTIEKAEK